MKTIKPVAVLLYYDGIQLFEGRDAIGGHYIAVLLGSEGKAERFLATGAKPERLRQFRVGELDLRTLLLEAPGGEWFFIDADAPYGEPLTLIPQKGTLNEREDLLPGEGYTMDDAPIDDLAWKRSREADNTVFEFSLDPPESARGHRVRADALGEILTQTQIVVKHACLRATNHSYRRVSKSDIDAEPGYLMDVVVPAAPGSFRIILEAAAPVDEPTLDTASNSAALVRGLELVDAVFESAEYPDRAREILQEHKGQLAAAYVKLLGILAKRNTGFNYSWADPHIPGSRYGGVTAAVAKRLYETLSEKTSYYAGSREVVVEGEFVRMDMRTGTWRLLTDSGNKQGKIRARDDISLEGLVAGDRYRFFCTRETRIVDASGRQSHTLYLDAIEPLTVRVGVYSAPLDA